MIGRIKELIEFVGITTSRFAKEIGVNQPTLDRQLKGVRGINVETLVAILERYTDVSSEWLMRGKGPMLISEMETATDAKFNSYLGMIADLSETINKKSARIEELSQEVKRLKETK